MSNSEQDGVSPNAVAADAVPAADKPKKKGRGRPKNKRRPPASKRKRNPRAGEATAKAIERQKKIADALALRQQNYSYADIATELGVKSARTAYEWVQEGLAAIPRENAQELLILSCERLDAMFSKMYSQFHDAPDPLYADSCMKIMRERLALEGVLLPGKVSGMSGRADGTPRGTPGDVTDAEFKEVLSADKPGIAPPMLLRPDEAIPANPIL